MKTQENIMHLVSTTQKEINPFEISLRELYSELNLTPDQFPKWVRRNIIGTEKKPSIYTEGIDYIITRPMVVGKHKIIDYLVTNDLAKNIALASKTELGQQYRNRILQEEKLKLQSNVELLHSIQADLDNYRTMALALQESNKALSLELNNSQISAVNLQDLYRVSRYKIGRNTLYSVLRNAGLLTKDNKPTSLAIKAGYFTMVGKDIFVSRNGLSYVMEIIQDREKQIIEMPNVSDINSLLASAIEGLNFDEPSHTYTYKNKVYKSVSTVLYNYVPEFPEEIMATNVANKRNREYIPEPNAPMFGTRHIWNKERVLAEWKLKRDIAANYGSFIHLELEKYACEKYLDNKEVKPLTIDESLINQEDMVDAYQTIQQGKYWLDNMIADGYELVDTEVMMINPILGYTGTIDLLFLKDGKLVIADWKSNRKDIYTDDYNQYMKSPFNTLKNSTVNKYKIQLNLYKKLMESIVPIEVSDLLIVHLTSDEVKVTESEDLTKYL